MKNGENMDFLAEKKTCLIKIILFTFSLSFAFTAEAQRIVKGKVSIKDGEESFVTVFIQELGTSNEVFVGKDGQFSFTTLGDSCKIKVSWYCGEKIIQINQDTLLDIYFDWDYSCYIRYSDEPVFTSDLWLKSIKEKQLEDEMLGEDCETYRFFWLRTFSKPICIRLEKKQDDYKLIYKTGKGTVGYDFWGLKKTKVKKITQLEWNYFRTLLLNASFDTLSNSHYFPMIDGVSWIFEHQAKDYYKGHYSNFPDSLLKVCGYYLLELSGDVFDKPNSATDYSKNRLYLNHNNELIPRSKLKDTLTRFLSHYLQKNPTKSDCFYIENIIIINSKGAIKKVKTIPIGKFLQNLAYYFENRTCRRTFRQALKQISLSNFKLKGTIKFYLNGSIENREAL